MASASKSASKPAPPRPAPRLMLVTPLVSGTGDLARSLDEALAAADIAAVILRLADDGDRVLINRAKELAGPVQRRDAALLLAGHPDLVARAGADGAHLSGTDIFLAAAPSLKPDRIAGVGGLPSRHDAMVAAEAGADYLLFGEPDADGQRPSFDAVIERIEWWAEVFEAPCVGYASTMDEIAPLVAAGADFVALDPALWVAAPGTALAAATRLLALPEPVAP
ncbi:MAG TPA: thiamine phosphate synthase [Pseudolabrys sp.]|nr:thiamine phosphate synthase [Pseudolabrys sp.]